MNMLVMLVFVLIASHLVESTLYRSNSDNKQSHNSFRRTRNSVYNENAPSYDKDAYYYYYRVHGADAAHYGEPQTFGQSEYRYNNQVGQ